jgi:hypothetical protein
MIQNRHYSFRDLEEEKMLLGKNAKETGEAHWKTPIRMLLIAVVLQVVQGTSATTVVHSTTLATTGYLVEF